MKINYIISFFILFSFIYSNSFSQSRIVIEGSVVDEYEMEVPYAAVGIIKKNIGVTSTEDGTFSFFVSNSELDDILEIPLLKNPDSLLLNKKEVEKLLSEIKKSDWVVKDIKEKPRTSNPKPPFTTSTRTCCLSKYKFK